MGKEEITVVDDCIVINRLVIFVCALYIAEIIAVKFTKVIRCMF